MLQAQGRTGKLKKFSGFQFPVRQLFHTDRRSLLITL
jgi:hypothetical protein